MKKCFSFNKLSESIKYVLSNVTIEPIVFCNYLAIAFFRVAEQAGIYQIVCIQNFQNLGVNCTKLKGNPVVEDMVQKDASTISMYLSLAYLIPAILSDTLLGAWSDKHGRQYNILLGIAGLMIAIFPFTVILTYHHTSLNILIITNIVAGFTGYVVIIVISSFAYLADVVHDKSTLTVRMAQVYVCSGAASAIGNFVAGSLVRKVSLPYAIMVSEMILFIGFLYVMSRIKQIPPLIQRKIASDKANNVKPPSKIDRKEKNVETATNDKRVAKLPSTRGTAMGVNLLKDIAILYRDVFHTFSRPRIGHRRCYIYLLSLVFFLYLTAEVGLLHGPIISLFVFHRPLFWSPSDLGYWKGTQYTIMLMGNLFGSWVLKKYLKFRDTTVMLICLTSAISHLVMLALSNKTWHMYLGIVCGMLSNLTSPTIKSFVAQQVDADEVGKAFTIIGIATDIGFVTSTLIFNNIYAATVEIFAGTVFFFASILLVLCFFIILWIHVDIVRNEQEVNDSGKETVAVTKL